MKDEKNHRLIQKIGKELGKTVLNALNDKSVIEISLNHDCTLFIEKFGSGMETAGKINSSQSLSAIKTIASFHDETITKNNPSISCELPIDGSRFEGLIPPVVANPTFSIRKKASKIFPLSDYVKSGIMNQFQLDRILLAVKNHENIVVVGGTGSGKTTLTNGIILEICKEYPEERIIIIEDTNEIQCSANNSVILHSTKHTPMINLLRSAMRLRPDRILVGEVRGGEAWTLLKAWNTGHPGGVVTVHADSAKGSLLRLEQLCAEESTAPQQPQYLKGVIAEAVNLIIFIKKTSDGRLIKEMREVIKLDKNEYLTKPIIS